MDALLVIHAAAGAQVLGVVNVESVSTMVALLLAMIGIIGHYVYQISLGATKSTLATASTERTPALMELGRIRGTFTNYSPWERHFGVLLLAVGSVCGVIGLLANQSGFKFGGIAAVAVGIIIVLYVNFKRIDNLVLHERGFVLQRGKSKEIAARYSEVVKFTKVIDTSNAIHVLKAVQIDLHDGSTLQIGSEFYKFLKLATELKRLCDDPREAEAWEAAQKSPPSDAVRTKGYTADELGEEIERFVSSGNSSAIYGGAALIAGSCAFGGWFLLNSTPETDRFRILFWVGCVSLAGILAILVGLAIRNARLVLRRNGLVFDIAWLSDTVLYADIRRVSVVTENDKPESVKLTLRDNQEVEVCKSAFGFKDLSAVAQRIEELRGTADAAIREGVSPTA